MVDNKINILLAEDDPEDRFILDEVFKEIGKRDLLHMVGDGTEIIRYLDSIEYFELYPELLVVDLNMPKLNGRETLRALKNDSRYSHIPVIIFSTSVNAVEKDECLSLGAIDYVTKPDSFEETEVIARMFVEFCAGSKKKMEG